MSEIKLYAMTCGWLLAPYGLFQRGLPGELAVPIPSYLIDHPKGLVIFDTGLERQLQYADTPEKLETALGGFSEDVSVRFLPGQNVAERLNAYGFEPDKISYLVNSHLHYDHCGGNELIRNAQHVLQRREWLAANDPVEIEKTGYFPRHYDLGHDRLLIDGDYDLFNDGTVVLLATYGHTPGHQSLKVSVEGKTVVITSDACYLKSTLEKLILPDPKVVNDQAAMLRNYALFNQLKQKGAVVLYGHDPEQLKELTDGALRRVTAEHLKSAKHAGL